MRFMKDKKSFKRLNIAETSPVWMTKVRSSTEWKQALHYLRFIEKCSISCVAVVPSPSHVWLFATSWATAHQASLSLSISHTYKNVKGFYKRCWNEFSEISLLFLDGGTLGWCLLSPSTNRYFSNFPWVWVILLILLKTHRNKLTGMKEAKTSSNGY